jgi:hypothetical protein
MEMTIMLPGLSMPPSHSCGNTDCQTRLFCFTLDLERSFESVILPREDACRLHCMCNVGVFRVQ